MKIYRSLILVAWALTASCSHAQDWQRDENGEWIRPISETPDLRTYERIDEYGSVVLAQDVTLPTRSEEKFVTFRWSCNEPIVLNIAYSKRPDAGYDVASVGMTIGSDSISQDILEPVKKYAGNEFFTAQLHCRSENHILFLVYADNYNENPDGVSYSANMVSEPIYLRPRND